MEAMRLGTLPIVAPTGGLKDTVEERCVGARAYVLAGATWVGQSKQVFASMFVEVEPTHFQDFPRSIPEQATMCLHAVWS